MHSDVALSQALRLHVPKLYPASHFVRFAQTGGEVLNTVLSIVIFTVPGVIIGAQLGSRVASRIPPHILEKALGVLFILVAILTLGEVLL